MTMHERTGTQDPKVSIAFWKDKLLPKGGGSKDCEQLWDRPMKKDKYGLGYEPSMGNT
ncbi:hypothetical protein A2U01_0104374, partial [Trifolium medium]|nr:hypothetical protein [Trifolium medium]